MGNLRVLKRSRKPVLLGDIFVLQVRDDEYIFGRVVRTDAMHMGFKDCVLIYIYKAYSTDKYVIPELDKNELLLPPMLTGPYMWTKGYFQTVENRPMSPHDVFAQHCFYSIRWGGSYMDADNNRLPERIEPCGFYGITVSQGVDREVSQALGLESDDSPGE